MNIPSSRTLHLPDRARWPVIVVGAGPAGLVVANTLARNGIHCLVVAKAAPSSHPKATVASLRTMEMLRSWGLDERVRAGGNDVDWRMLVTDTLAGASRGQLIDVGYPSIEQSATISPTRPWAVPQDHLERVLLDDLRRRPTARVEIGVAVEAVRLGPEGVRLTVRDAGTGLVQVVAGSYLVAADGAYSTVRDAVGVAAPTSPGAEKTVTAVVHAPLWDVLADHRFGIYATQSPVPGTFLPAGPDDRWLLGFADSARTPQELTDRVRAAAGVPDIAMTIGSIKEFSFVAALSERFRSGNVFLVGDAAHRVTPRGGTGMNMAIAGAANLGWKLAWVLRGWAAESLLNSYESERRPVAEHNIERSLDPMGSRRTVATEVPIDLAGRVPHRWLEAGGGGLSTVDLVGPGLTRLVSTAEPRRGVRAPAGPPVVVRRLDPSTAAEVGADRPGGLLVRPDGIPLTEDVFDHLWPAALRAA
jgi:putative polyketide hydroxylase